MFHVLAQGCEKLIAWPEDKATKILCTVKTPREAITSKRFISLLEQNKLNKDRCCAACFRIATGGFQRR